MRKRIEISVNVRNDDYFRVQPQRAFYDCHKATSPPHYRLTRNANSLLRLSEHTDESNPIAIGKHFQDWGLAGILPSLPLR
jgi:hypothetical protein